MVCRFDGRPDAPTSALPLLSIRGQLIKQLPLLRGWQLAKAVEQQLVDRPGRGPQGARVVQTHHERVPAVHVQALAVQVDECRRQLIPRADPRLVSTRFAVDSHDFPPSTATSPLYPHAV